MASLAFIKRLKENFNWLAIFVVVAIAGIGLEQLANIDHFLGLHVHEYQVMWVVLGTIVIVLLAWVNYSVYAQLAYVIYGVLLILLIIVLIFGVEVHNSKRWLKIFGITLQPSEFTKLAVIFVLARFFSDQRTTERYALRQLGKPILLILAPATLILVEPDLGTTLLLLLIAFSMIFFVGVKLRTFLTLVCILLAVVPVAWRYGFVRQYQKDRVVIWMNCEAAKNLPKARRDRHIQPEQAKLAVGSGRFFGKGYRRGDQTRMKAMPEIQTDFIFAAFAEEWGFVGSFVLLMLYYLLVVWAFRVADRARDKFGAMVAVGVAFMIFWQIAINIGMVIGMLPVTGITLPLISYGGSSFLTIMAGFGALLSISINR